MKTKELIDKYEVRQSTDTEYNPPSYIWIDNTGEIIRCVDCMHNGSVDTDCPVRGWSKLDTDFCSWAERKEV